MCSDQGAGREENRIEATSLWAGDPPLHLLIQPAFVSVLYVRYVLGDNEVGDTVLSLRMSRFTVLVNAVVTVSAQRWPCPLPAGATRTPHRRGILGGGSGGLGAGSLQTRKGPEAP